MDKCKPLARGYLQPAVPRRGWQGGAGGAAEDEGFTGHFGGSGARADGAVLVDALRAIRSVMVRRLTPG